MPRLADRQLERLADALLDQATAHRGGILVFDLAAPGQRAELAGIVRKVAADGLRRLGHAEATIARVVSAVTRPQRGLDELVPVRVVLDAVYGRPDTPLPPGQTPEGSR